MLPFPSRGGLKSYDVTSTGKGGWLGKKKKKKRNLFSTGRKSRKHSLIGYRAVKLKKRGKDRKGGRKRRHSPPTRREKVLRSLLPRKRKRTGPERKGLSQN